MKKIKIKGLDFTIDKLTNSIENAVTGEIFQTHITLINSSDLKIIRKSKWHFRWEMEIVKKDRKVYKLETIENPGIIHGLISIAENNDHILMHHLENAHFNIGKHKIYDGVAGNLVAFACKVAFEKNFDGIVAFTAKTQLIEHYKETLNAKQYSGQKMFIDSKDSLSLVQQYFKDFSL